eukprot:jgi/Botrbrau1/4931/Bobra.0122s0013.1
MLCPLCSLAYPHMITCARGPLMCLRLALQERGGYFRFGCIPAHNHMRTWPASYVCDPLCQSGVATSGWPHYLQARQFGHVTSKAQGACD